MNGNLWNDYYRSVAIGWVSGAILFGRGEGKGVGGAFFLIVSLIMIIGAFGRYMSTTVWALLVGYTGVTIIFVVAAAVFIVLWRLSYRWMFYDVSKKNRKGAAGVSEITTDTLVMRLDNATGELSGKVRRGRFARRDLASLGLGELIELLAECQRDDPRSVPLMETYLDRTHPGWHEHMAGGERQQERQEQDHGADGSGSYAQACKLFELPEDCDQAIFKQRYRQMQAKNHPDQGGSTVIAQMLNAAADTIRKHRGWA